MSQILWQKALVPPAHTPLLDRNYELYTQGFRVNNTLSFAEGDEELVTLPDPRTYRSLSRAGILLSAAGLAGKELLEPYCATDPYSIGLYCAVENGPTDFACAKAMTATARKDFAQTYKRLRTAKQYLRQLPNLAAAQLGIFLDLRGPMNVYNHARFAGLQALEQAEADLAQGFVQVAMVGAAFSLEDPLIAKRVRRQLPEQVTLSEGAAFMLLKADHKVTKWDELLPAQSEYSYGIASDLVHLCQGGLCP